MVRDIVATLLDSQLGASEEPIVVALICVLEIHIIKMPALRSEGLAVRQTLNVDFSVLASRSHGRVGHAPTEYECRTRAASHLRIFKARVARRRRAINACQITTERGAHKLIKRGRATILFAIHTENYFDTVVCTAHRRHPPPVSRCAEFPQQYLW